RGDRAIAEAAGARQPGEQLVGGRAAAAALRGEQFEHERTLGAGPARLLGGSRARIPIGAGAGDRQAGAEDEEAGSHGGDTSGTCRGYCMTICARPALVTVRVS